jgi:hypothetical protein
MCPHSVRASGTRLASGSCRSHEEKEARHPTFFSFTEVELAAENGKRTSRRKKSPPNAHGYPGEGSCCSCREGDEADETDDAGEGEETDARGLAAKARAFGSRDQARALRSRAQARALATWPQAGATGSPTESERSRTPGAERTGAHSAARPAFRKAARRRLRAPARRRAASARCQPLGAPARERAARRALPRALASVGARPLASRVGRSWLAVERRRNIGRLHPITLLPERPGVT